MSEPFHGTYCWACGKHTTAAWYVATHRFNGHAARRCTDCHRADAPIRKQHCGKLTPMDRLPMASHVQGEDK